MSSFDQAPELQLLRINDFSPGIVQFSRFNFPLLYSSSAPLGSASFAVRCCNQPGVGLVPFPKVSTYGSGPVTLNRSLDNGVPVYCTGFQAFGPISPSVNQPPQMVTSPDFLYVSFDYISSTNRIREVTVQKSASQANLISLNTLSNAAYRFCPNFVVTRVFQNIGPLSPVVAWVELDYDKAYFSPDITAAGGTMGPVGNVSLGTAPIHLIAHEARLSFLQNNFIPVSFTPQIDLSVDEDLFTTDPPESSTFTAGPTAYVPESIAGFGAWGSINSGELLIIKRSGGAALITGDILAPTGVVKLPGVVGTGRVMQKGSASMAGLIYVTESDGVYAWNGSNTSQKISTQIPDDGTRRKELPDSSTVGNLSTHDTIGQWTFFANNWVFDAESGSWWQCEDPSVTPISLFSRGSTSRYMYGAQGTNAAANISTYQIDFYTPASTYTWISNPLPVIPGTLAELAWVEAVISNPSATSCTVIITPTPPSGVTPISGNNPQKVTFTIPPLTSAMRVGDTLGYRDYNIQIRVDASNSNNSNSAPIIHEINLGFRPGAAIGRSQ